MCRLHTVFPGSAAHLHLHLFPSVNWQRRDPAERISGSFSNPSQGFHQSSIRPRSRLAVSSWRRVFSSRAIVAAITSAPHTAPRTRGQLMAPRGVAPARSSKSAFAWRTISGTAASSSEVRAITESTLSSDRGTTRSSASVLAPVPVPSDSAVRTRYILSESIHPVTIPSFSFSFSLAPGSFCSFCSFSFWVSKRHRTRMPIMIFSPSSPSGPTCSSSRNTPAMRHSPSL
mmetsp:Transcript_35969/g.85121  ORF Transcript_35969/g.85121 Transcript_35969/m.85121 type:complete len:230 (+) Transcript_35969:375-1064(+)